VDWSKGCYRVTDNQDCIDTDFVKSALKTTYWAQDRPWSLVEKSISHSLLLSVFADTGEQVGFARIVSDYSCFAWICDVYIQMAYRDAGLGKWLMEIVMSHPATQVKMCVLATKDAHGLYKKYGFEMNKQFMSYVNPKMI